MEIRQIKKALEQFNQKDFDGWKKDPITKLVNQYTKDVQKECQDKLYSLIQDGDIFDLSLKKRILGLQIFNGILENLLNLKYSDLEEFYLEEE